MFRGKGLRSTNPQSRNVYLDPCASRVSSEATLLGRVEPGVWTTSSGVLSTLRLFCRHKVRKGQGEEGRGG